MILENRKDIIPEVGHFFIGRRNEFFRDWDRKDGELYILDEKHKPLIKMAGLEELCKITLFSCYKFGEGHCIKNPKNYRDYHSRFYYHSGNESSCLHGVDFRDIPSSPDFLRLIPEEYIDGLEGFELEKPGRIYDAFGYPISQYYDLILYVGISIKKERREKLLKFFKGAI